MRFLRVSVVVLVVGAVGAPVAVAGTGSLSVLDRPATKRDKLKPRLRASLERSGIETREGADLDGSRQTVKGVWAIPAGENVCLLVELRRSGSGFSCGPLAAAVDGMQMTGPYPGNPRRRMTAGLVGDGVKRVRFTFANGRSTTVRVVDNGFKSGPLKPGTAVTVTYER